MAFATTDQNPTLVQVTGTYAPVAVGLVTMSSGKATETINVLHRVDGCVGMVQGATGVGETVIAEDITGNVVKFETVAEGGTTTGTSVVMYIAWGPARL